MGVEPSVPVVAVIDYENPTVVDAALRMEALAVLVSLVRSAGIPSSLAMAKHTHPALREARRRAARLEQKLLSTVQITEAKAILVRTRNIGDSDAYKVIREQAMEQARSDRGDRPGNRPCRWHPVVSESAVSRLGTPRNS